MPPEQKPKSSNLAAAQLILAAVILISFAAVLGAAVYLLKNKPVINPEPTVLPATLSVTPTPKITPVINDSIDNWKTYRNEEYGFEFKYPKDYSISEKLGNIKISKKVKDKELWLIDIQEFSDYRLNSDRGVSRFDELANDIISQHYCIYSFDKYDFSCDINKIRKKEFINYYGINGFEVYMEEITTDTYTKTATNRIKGPLYVFNINRKDRNIIRPMIFNFDDKSEILDKKEKDFVTRQILTTFKFIDRDSFICGTSKVTDIDNNIYNTVKIGEQCWLKENLKVTKNPAGEPITRYCYDNDPKICETDGGLYDWNTAMNNSVVEGAQGICPNGWHVPKDSDWHVLENYLKDEGQTCDGNRKITASDIRRGLTSYDCANAGVELKQGGSSKFEGIFAGARASYGSFYSKNVNGIFWSSLQSGNAETAWSRSLNLSSSLVDRSTQYKLSNFSVRCLKD